MPGTVAAVRALVNDKPQWASVTETGDGSTKQYQLPYAPVKALSQAVYVAGVLQTVTTHYTIDTDLGLVTFVTAPGSGVTVLVEYQYYVLSDADIQVMLDQFSSDLFPDLRAAELWCSTVAGQQNLLLKATKLLDVEVDGPAVAEAYLAMGKRFRDQQLRDRFLSGKL